MATEFVKRKPFRITITVIFVSLMIYANFVIVKSIERYGIQAYVYDKLSVAYSIGSATGMKEELSRILSQHNTPAQLKIAKEFEKKLPGIENPDKFLKDNVTEKIAKIRFLKNVRSTTVIIIILLLALRIFTNIIIARGK